MFLCLVKTCENLNAESTCGKKKEKKTERFKIIAAILRIRFSPNHIEIEMATAAFPKM